MKRTTFLVAFCCLAFLSNAQEIERSTPLTMEITTLKKVNQALITTSNGIEVYYSSTTDHSGNTLLNLHFVNTSEEAKTFTWQISKEGQLFKCQKVISITSEESFDQNAVLEVKGTTDLSNYSITLISK